MIFIRFPKKNYKSSKIIVRISAKTKPKVNFQNTFACLSSINSKATKINLAAQRIKSIQQTQVLPSVVFVVTKPETKVRASKAMKVYSFEIFIFKRLSIKPGTITAKSNHTCAKTRRRFSHLLLRLWNSVFSWSNWSTE